MLKSNDKWQKKNMPKIIAIIVSVVFLVVTIIAMCVLKEKFLRYLIVMLITELFCLINSVIGLINKIRKIKKEDLLPYNFSFNDELLIYKSIGANKNKKVYKKLNNKYNIPSVYTEWESDIRSRHLIITDNEINNKNFYHFLKHRYRFNTRFYDNYVVVLIPIEVALFAYIFSLCGLIFSMIIVAIFAIIFSFDIYNTRVEKEFINDVIEVLCPKYKLEKD